MKQDKYSNIYRSGKSQRGRQRRIIVVLCLTICVLSVITCVVLIKNMQERKNTGISAEQTVQNTPVPSLTESSSVTVSSETSGGTTAAPSSASSNPASSTQTVTAEQRTAALETLSASIKTLLDSQSGRYSVYYINMNNGETLGYKETDPMVSASSIKIAYNTYLYKKAAEGTLSMDEEMAYNASPYPEGDLETGTGTIQTTPNGTKYTLSALSNLSVTISDNCATNMILRRLGGIDAVNTEYMVPISAVVNYRTAASYTDYAGTAQSGKQRTSATDLAMYAKNLYTLYKANPDDYTKLMTDLCTTEYTWGIPAGVSDDYKVAHKVGFNPAYGSNNDVGIVFAQEDYILCVMTESGSDSNGQTVIGQVSQLVFDYLSGCYS